MNTCFSLLSDGAPAPSDSYALYSSFSPNFQKYLEGLYAVHSAVAQADGSRAAGHTVRREPVESIHPIVRVHPTTGWKSIYVNPGRSMRCISALRTRCSCRWHQGSRAASLACQRRRATRCSSSCSSRLRAYLISSRFYPCIFAPLTLPPFQRER